MRTYSTIEYIGLWEMLNNPTFNPHIYEGFKKESAKPHFWIIYASEADVLNVALFGITAKQWRDNNPDLKGNIRDYASINELICLSNMENINAMLINDSISQKERLIKLNKIAIQQISVLNEAANKKLLR